MSQEIKDSHVKLFMTVGTPFLGAVSALRDHIGGNLEFTKKIMNHLIGLNYYT